MEIIPELGPAVFLTLPFLVAMVALYAILFKPMMAYLDERKHVAHDALHEADELKRSADERMARVEARLAEARKAASDLRTAARARAHTQETAILAEARKAADGRVASAVAQIAAARVDAGEALRHTAGTLSTDITRQVLGRELGA